MKILNGKGYSLIIVNSVYQLMSAINLKRKVLANESVDIIVTDVTPVLPECIPRLKEIRIFERVIFAKTHEMNKKYATAIEPDTSYAFSNAKSILQWAIDEELACYTKVYFSNYDFFTRLLACFLYEEKCDFVCFEDGFSTYVIDFLDKERAKINMHKDGIKIKNKIKEVLLYEPLLGMRNDGLVNKQLPKIEKTDRKVIEQLNYVFGYEKLSDNYNFIFLEQSFRADGIKSNDLQLIKECADAVERNSFIVKPHPRNSVNQPLQMGLSSPYKSSAPWELVLLNEDFKNKTLITVCSNAALTSRIVLDLDINTVMLYELFIGKVLWKEDEILKHYLNMFQRLYAGKNYYVPKTIYELRNILKYLGGKNE